MRVSKCGKVSPPATEAKEAHFFPRNRSSGGSNTLVRFQKVYSVVHFQKGSLTSVFKKRTILFENELAFLKIELLKRGHVFQNIN